MRKKISRSLALSLAAAMTVSLAGGNPTGGVELVQAAASEELQDTEFTGDLWSDGIWSVNPEDWTDTSFKYKAYSTDSYLTTTADQGTSGFDFWSGSAQVTTLTQTVTLEKGTYVLNVDAEGESAEIKSYVKGSGEASIAAISGATSIDRTETSESLTLNGYGNWIYGQSEIVISEAGEYTVGLAIDISDGGYGLVDSVSLVKKEAASLYPDELVNADFETDDAETNYDSITGWDITLGEEAASAQEQMVFIKTDSDTSANTSKTLHIWAEVATQMQAEQTIHLAVGSYKMKFAISGDTAKSGLSAYVKTESSSLTTLEIPATEGWGVYTDVETEEFTLTQAADVTIGFSGTLNQGYWGDIDNVSIVSATEEEDTTNIVTGDKYTGDPVSSTLYAKKNEELTTGFYTGFDISSVDANYKSGAKYYNYAGKSLSEAEFFTFLAENGVNCVRIRLWNDPYSSDGKTYGGGANDIETAKVLAKYATDAGMDVLLDFHMSDFWTDPGKQAAPKAWASYTVSEKAEAINTFVTESLTAIENYGGDIDMVQVGNETNGKYCGETDMTNVCTLFNAAAGAIRAYDDSIKIVVHFTNPEKTSNMLGYASTLAANNVDYDVFATSYYPYWHGTISNLNSVLSTIASTYKKYVMVAETSWAYTLQDGDGHDNTVRVGNNDSDNDYPFSEQGQVQEMAAVIGAVSSINRGLGVFFWEPAWIPVEDVSELSGTEKTEAIQRNQEAWETYGSGWAASAAAEYDPNDAGQWYGGSAVDNENVFDFSGNPLESLKMFNLIRYGSTASGETLVEVKESQDSVTLDTENYTGPSTVEVVLANGETQNVDVVWDAQMLADAFAAGVGNYDISGTITWDGESIAAILHLTISYENLLEDWSFENGPDASKWTNVGNAAVKNENPKTGTYAYHWWSSGDTLSYDVYQTVTLEPGAYTFGGSVMGGATDMDNSTLTLYAAGTQEGTLDEVTDTSGIVTAWNVWHDAELSFVLAKEAEVKLGIRANLAKDDSDVGSWGSWDDMYLYRTADVYTTTIYSRTEGSGEAVAELDEVEAAKAGENVTVMAPNKSAAGYQFLGWYNVTAVEDGKVTGYDAENVVSTNLRYTFKAEENKSLVAVYKTLGKATVKVNVVNGASYTVGSDTTVKQGGDEQVLIGSVLTLSAVDSDLVFQWKNESGKVLGTGSSITITVTSDTSIELVYKTEVESQAFVTFMTDYGQVIQGTMYSSSSRILFPVGPSKTGCTFLYWSLDGTTKATEETIQNAIAALTAGSSRMLTLKPVYETASENVTVQVACVKNGETLSGYGQSYEESIGTGLTLVAPVISGETFRCWAKDSAGTKILSTSQSYFMQVIRGETIYAIYSDEAMAAVPIISITNLSTTVAGETHKIVAAATRDVPEGYTLIEQGMLYGKDLGSLDEDSFIYGTEGVSRFVSSSKKATGVMVLNKKVEADSDIWYFRGYMVVKNDATGEITNYYTGIVSRSYAE